MSDSVVAARSLLFNVVAFTWGLAMHVVCLPLLVLPRSLTVVAGRLWVRSTLWLLRMICGLDFRVEGLEKLPPGPSIIASKHQSAWDTLIFSLVLRDPTYVLKRELMFAPLFGWFLWKYGVVSVDRKGGAKSLKAMTADAAEMAARGRSIVIFPEGTRTAPGTSLPYHPGVAALARELQLPTVPVALDSGQFWRRRSFIKRPGTITLRFLDPIEPPLGKGSGKPQWDRKAYLETLKQRIETACAALG